MFGVKPNTCVFIWLNLGGNVPAGTKPEHLLWGLAFYKLYEVEDAFSTRVHADPKTCRKWIKIIVNAFSEFNLGSFIVIPSLKY